VTLPFRPLRDHDLVFVDGEMTGLDPTKHELLELAAVRLSPKLEERRAFERKVRPTRIQGADPEALRIVGYTPHGWRFAVPRRVACIDYQALVDGGEYLFVAHHAAHDVAFLKAAFAEEALVFPEPRLVLDTLAIAWPLHAKGVVDTLSLDALCAKYAIPNAGHHQAMADVRRLIALYRKMLNL